MALYLVHKLLIGAAILLLAGFSGWAAWAVSNTSRPDAGFLIVLAAGSFISATGLIVYLLWFIRRTRKG